MAKNITKNSIKENVKYTSKKHTPKKKTEGSNPGQLWTRTRDYLTSVYNELKKVHWPDRRTLVAYTIVVLVAVALVSALLFLLDWIIGFLLGLLF